MPNALLEAMACGKANVATSVNGAPELVKDGITGFLVPSDDADALFEKIFKILADDELRNSMGKNSEMHVKEEFTYKKMSYNLEKLFISQIAKFSKR